jgi:DNA-binding response OmpR family regulator
VPKRIAWIEDDIDIIGPVARPLRRAGYEFLELRTVQEVLESLDDVRHCDLILLDMILPTAEAPGMRGRYPGLELLRMFRDELSVDVPTVVLTVVAGEHTLAELRRLGVSDIIHKPVLPSELAERILRVLGVAPA